MRVTNYDIKILFLALLLCVGITAYARRKHKPVILPVYEQPSVVVEDDGAVTFRYCGEGKHVYLLTDFLFVDEDTIFYTDHSHKIKMEKQSNGCFYVTTRPVSPETYTYCFRVDGKRVPDPLNNDTAWERLHKWNVVTVGGTPETDIYLQPKKQGELIRAKWYSTEEKIYRRVNIYLPAAISHQQSPITNHQSFPVLYLIHGINGYEGSWTERGRAIQVMENLAAQGKIEPTILVMPDCNVGPHEDRPSHHTLFNNIMHYPRLQHDHRIEHAVSELIRMVDSIYPVSGNQAIAGLSDGARLAANIANENPGHFNAVGMFSPVVHKSQLPCDSCTDTRYFIYAGKADFFINNSRRFYHRLQKQRGVERDKNTPSAHLTIRGSGHNWRNWRRFGADFLTKWQGKE